MFRAFFLSLAQLGDPAIRRVLVRSLAVTFALFAAAGVAMWWGVRAALTGWLGAQAGGWSAALTLVVELLALWLAFRAVAVAVVGIFADDIVAAVEARHYPQALASARPVALARGMAMGLGSALRVIAINLLLLPLYIVLLATGVGTAAAFLLVNAWLLSRDLGDMVAARHMDGPAMRRWRKATGPARFLLGLAAAALFVVPGLNLLAPVLGASMATHFFHKRRQP
ncbi:EI24 domain-containing protein [Sphingomonas sp. SORGH_AS_0879]|uniref:EI24 domain-containing protein n=1 Tax=Sphingomonas sp. SORGH_AS_0879 TaxID=3041790 RepID=UPI002783E6D1|nr:EI24 domain-containing protein [Sphingomonas sp. SORGH_AS_0879]MDQ1229879.1 CysZ protein [Sphingomonas sp. SORGH_AS_0879]